MIRCRMTVDDWAFDAYEFDATSYFAALSSSTLPNVVDEVISIGGGGDYPADNVVLAFEKSDPAIGERMEYLYRRMREADGGDHPGFEGYVNLTDLAAWLQVERPLTFARHQAALSEAAARQSWD